MYNRYNKTKIINNTDQNYNDIFKTRNIKSIRQYSTFNFNNLKNINDADFDIVIHNVQPFEKLYNISQKYYNTPEFGWLICYTNKIPSELSIKAGMYLKIYLPLQNLLGLL